MSSYIGTEWSLGRSLAGGAIISASTVFVFLMKGRIAGLSSILSGLYRPFGGEWPWKCAFVSGFIGGVAFINYVHPQIYLSIQAGHSILHYCIGGLLVGIGSRIGNGCTSGHGICGLARFSKRSLVAVVTFMTSAALVATSLNVNDKLVTAPSNDDLPNSSINPITCALSLGLATLSYLKYKENNNLKGFLAVLPAGFLFSIGLSISGMTDPTKVLSFLVLQASTWDPSLACVMIGAIPLTALGFQFATRRGNPMLAESFCVPSNKVIDLRLLFGAWIFGLGWGVAGICPGPGIVLAAAGVRNAYLYFFPFMSVGMVAAEKIVSTLDI